MAKLPTSNPFEGLFGESATQNPQQAIKPELSKNPFEGLFEAKQESGFEKTKIPSINAQYGLPEATISANPKQEPKKESLLSRAVKAILPRSLEVKFGVTEPNLREQMMISESARQSYYRDKDFENVLKKEGVDLKKPRALSETYTEPTGLFDSIVEGVKFGYGSTIKPAVGYLVESMGHDFMNPKWIKWGQEFGDKQVANLLKKPELFAPQDLPEFFQGGAFDIRYYGRKIGETIPFVATVLGTTTIAGLTKNPSVVSGVAFGTTYAIERANSYKQMLDQGIAPDKAVLASNVYGVIASAIENSFGFRPAQIVLGESGSKIVTENFKKSMLSQLSAYSSDFLKKVLQEGGEEGAQQLTQNLVTKWLDSSQGIWEGVAESIPAGMIGALPFGASDIIGSLKKYTSLKNQVSSPENQDNQTMIRDLSDEKNNLDFQYELKKQAIFDFRIDQNLPSLISVNVADIGNGNFLFDYEVNTLENSLSSDYIVNGTVKSKEEAIEISKKAILEWVNGQKETASPQVLSQFETILSELQKEEKQPIVSETLEIEQKKSTEIHAVKTYHITPEENIISIQKEGLKPSDNGVFGNVGFSATTEELSREHIPSGKTIELSIQLENPLIIPDAGKTPFESLKKSGYKTFEDWAKAENKDGVIIKNADNKGGDVYLTLNPESTIKQQKKNTKKIEIKEITAKKIPQETQIDAKEKDARDVAKDLIRSSIESGETQKGTKRQPRQAETEEISVGKQEKQEKQTPEDVKLPRELAGTKRQPRFAKPKKESKKILSSEEVINKIIPKRPKSAILGEVKVEQGNLYVTDLDVNVKLKTDLSDGMYKIIGKDSVKTQTNSKEFPSFSEVNDEKSPLKITIKTEELSKLLKQSVLFVDKKGFREEIKGVLFKIENGKLIIASTDSFRLSMQIVDTEFSGDGEFILSNPEKVQKIISVLGDTAQMTISENNLKIAGQNGEIVLKVSERPFPEFKQIIPQYTQRQGFDRQQMVSALKELKPYAKETIENAIFLKYSDGKMQISVENKEKNISKQIEIDAPIPEKTSVGERIYNNGIIVMPIREDDEKIKTKRLKFNVDYIDDVMKSLDTENFYLFSTEDIEKPHFFSSERDLISEEKKEDVEQPKRKKAPTGMASAGSSSIGSFEELAGIPEKTEEEFKLYEEVRNLIMKYAKTIGEDYLPRNALGVFYPDTTNIRIKGMNHLAVATHEIAHFLDIKNKISEQIRGVEAYSIKGRPIYDKETYQLRKEITDLYVRYYVGGKKNHPLKKRVLEGFATLLEKYTETPSTIEATYPNLVKEFLKLDGKFYTPVIGDILVDLKNIVKKYQGLPALDKVGSRVINDEVAVNKDSFLNFWEKLKTEIADNVYPIEVLAKKAGIELTKNDPSLWVRQYNNSNTLILNNIKGHKGFWGWRNGQIEKILKYNWKDLISEMAQKRVSNDFGYWLVARREYFAYQELKGLQKEMDQAKQLVKAADYALNEAKDAGADLEEFFSDIRRVKAIYDNAEQAYVSAKAILENDGFTKKEVSDAYLLNQERFSDIAEKYDALVREDLNFLHDSTVGLVDKEQYDQLTSKEGYASFKRYFYDEVVGEEEVSLGRVRFGRTKVSSLIQRKGSQKPILNPIYSAIKNHAEITRKGLKQIVYNRMGDVARKAPELGVFQELQLEGIPDRQGRITFPQEKDPNIIMARLNYKRVPFLVENTIKRTVDEVLNFQNINIFEKILLGSSRFFTKGTTGLFPGFALTNYTVDQITATAQTREKYIPLYDPLHTIQTIFDRDSQEHVYLQEYLIMGGERQTFVGWQDLSPNELFDAIGKERAGLLKIIDAINSGVDIFALPSKWSEIMTRATEYIKARQTGKSSIVALEESGRVTAPFHHIGRFGGGRVGQTYIKSIPFFNPGIQVLAQAIETLETPEGRKRYAFVALGLTASSIASLGLIMSFGSDDQKKLFADINPDELNKYIWLPSLDGKNLIKIRVPDQMEVFATLINMFVADKKLQANYTVGEYLNAMTSWLPAQADITQPIKMFMAWIPQIIKPGALTIAGVKDFPKIMPLESQTIQNRAPEYRYTEATSPVAKWLGEKLGLSPIKIDYLLTGYLGRSVGFATGKPGILNPFKAMSREYYFTSGRKIQTFYELKEENDQKYEAYKKGRKDFKFGERTEILKKRAKLKEIEKILELYKDIDIEKQPERAKKLQIQILSKINDL